VKLGVVPAYGIAPVESAEYATGFAALVEELGFESVWVGEHVVMPTRYSSRYPYTETGRTPDVYLNAVLPDPIVWLTWAAAVTRTLRLGSCVLILPQRNPLVLAKQVASLDRLCGGRVLLGVGAGWLREEAVALGTSFEDRGARMEEWILAMRALWSQPVASFRGAHVRFEEVECRPHPANGTSVPILIGGHSPAAARRAGRLGDGFLPMQGGAGGDLRNVARLRRIAEGAAREAGRDPTRIEITSVGSARPDLVKAFADAGITRMVVYSLERDVPSARAALEPFMERISRDLGTA